MTGSSRRTLQERGFSLLESVVALALIGVSILVGTAFLNSMVRSSTRVQAGSELLRELEAAAEMLRAGLVPLESGIVAASGPSDRFPDLTVTALVERGEVQGLYDVTLSARCSVAHGEASRVLVTRVWRP